MFKLLWQNEDGMVLPLVVVMIAVFTILGFSALFMVDTQAGLEEKEIQRTGALHYAEAGINDYLGHLNRRINVPWDKWNVPVPFEDGYYQLEQVEFDESSLTRVIQATGWVAGDEGNKRTIRAKIGRRAFNEYAYFSHDDGPSIYWKTGEVCYGPYHTNNILNISGTPTFYGPVTYSKDVIGVGNNAKKIFRAGYRMVPEIKLPNNNYQLKERALEGGHYYFGRTRILLDGDRYHVKYFEEITDGHGRKTYQEQEKRNLPLPENGVIYVDGGNDGKFAATSGNLFIAGELSGNLTVGAANDIYILGYDPLEDQWEKKVKQGNKTVTKKPDPVPNAATQGIVYKNTVFRQVKSGKEVTGYEADGDDMLGLVANSKIRILGEGWFDRDKADVAPNNITIHAALFSINEGFGYESYTKYEKENIILRGSLVQHTRKPVGQTDWMGKTGYYKDYAHDPRMLTTAPPNFPEPLNTGWEIKEWIVDPPEDR